MKEPRTHVFRGRRWNLADTASDMGGECEGPHVKGRTMTIPIHAETLYDLEVQLHEALHACDWDLGEEAVAESARDMARYLWRLGWRCEQESG